MQKIVTFEAVAQAANAMLESGEKPSVRKIMAALGGGSPNSVNQFLSEWRTGRPTVSHAVQIGEPLLKALRDQIQEAAVAAAEAAEARAAESADVLVLVQDELTASNNQIEALQNAVADLEAEKKSQSDVIIEMQNQVQNLTQTLEGERIKIVELVKQHDQYVAENARSTLQLETANQRIASLTGDLDQIRSQQAELAQRATAAEQAAAQSAAEQRITNERLADAKAIIAEIKSQAEKAAEGEKKSQSEKAKLEGLLSAVTAERDRLIAELQQKVEAFNSQAKAHELAIRGHLQVIEEMAAKQKEDAEKAKK